MKIQYYYLIEIQYLGFRFHGWQTQPGLATIQEKIHKTLRWVLPDNPCKILAVGRTDKMVSVQQSYFELFTEQQISSLDEFLLVFNQNLPADIRALSIQETNKTFNIIKTPKVKEYQYYFSYGEKFHPFAAAFLTNILGDLDIALMEQAVKVFEGKHNFYSYTFRPTANTNTFGEIFSCSLEKNKDFTASFFPKDSYVVKIKGSGFKRNQIRLMMGMLFDLGRHEKSWNFFIETLKDDTKIKLSNVAPASGLQLNNVNFI